MRLPLLRRPERGGSPHRFELPRRADVSTLALYLVAGAAYVAIGVVETDFLLSWYVGAAYLLLVVWLAPAAVRRLR